MKYNKPNKLAWNFIKFPGVEPLPNYLIYWSDHTKSLKILNKNFSFKNYFVRFILNMFYNISRVTPDDLISDTRDSPTPRQSGITVPYRHIEVSLCNEKLSY